MEILYLVLKEEKMGLVVMEKKSGVVVIEKKIWSGCDEGKI